MPIYNLVIKILQYLSDNYVVSTGCIYQKRHYLDKSLSNINEFNILDSVKSIDDDFFECFDKKDTNKIKSLIYAQSQEYLRDKE